MSYVIKIDNGIPDDALVYFNASTNEYYVITDNLGNILTWGVA